MTDRQLIVMTPVVRDVPETGGEAYTNRVLAALSERWDVHTLTWGDLGLTNRAPAREFAERSAQLLHDRGHRGPILQDTVVYSVGSTLNRVLKAAGHGPIIGFGQAVYPLRATTRLGQAARLAYFGRYLRTCDGHIVVSRYVRRVARALGTTRPISVVYPGFDLVDAYAAPRGGSRDRDERVRIVSAGTYIPSKGQHLLVRAIAHLVRLRPDLRDRFVVDLFGGVGDPEHFQSIVSVVDSATLNDVVGLHGHVPQAQLWKHLETADLFIFMARGEGLGMVVGEAMLLGCAPIVTNSGPMRELIEPGVSGLLAPPRMTAVADLLIQLITDRERLRLLADSAQAQARRCLRGWADTTTLFADELDRLVTSTESGTAGRAERLLRRLPLPAA